MKQFSMTINGSCVGPDSGSCLSVINPATERVIAHAPDCSRVQLDWAVQSAQDAFCHWADMSWVDRRHCLQAVSDVLVEHVSELKEVLTAEQGKPLAEAEAEIRGAANVLRSVSELDLPAEIVRTPERRIETTRLPIGPVAAIPPWNFPLTLAAMKIAPALLCGNTVVLKPSPFTPLATLMVGELAQRVLPSGVLNVISGSDRLGPWLTEHPGIRKISFTGSTATGKKVMQSASLSLKHLTLELGGNDAAIVLEDVDVGNIAETVFWSAFRNAGQVCVATKRLYVHHSIFSSLQEALTAYARKVIIADGSMPGTQMGPVSNKSQHQRLVGLLEDCRQKGWRMSGSDKNVSSPGYFLPVTFVDNPTEDSRIVQEEQFGPILPILRFKSVDEAVSRANASAYGLGASIWSSDLDRARQLSGRLDAGSVWINSSPAMHPMAPFGGHKQSGIGIEGGRDGLLANTVTKSTFYAGVPTVF